MALNPENHRNQAKHGRKRDQRVEEASLHAIIIASLVLIDGEELFCHRWGADERGLNQAGKWFLLAAESGSSGYLRTRRGGIAEVFYQSSVPREAVVRSSREIRASIFSLFS